jgi:predicted RNA-binding protein with EMAP domain
MAKTTKEPKQAERGVNILNDPEEKKKFKSALAAITHELQMIDDRRESIKEQYGELSSMYGLDKKIIRKLATTMYKHNYTDVVDEMNHFQALYETLVNGKLSDAADPLDDDGSGSDEED